MSRQAGLSEYRATSATPERTVLAALPQTAGGVAAVPRTGGSHVKRCVDPVRAFKIATRVDKAVTGADSSTSHSPPRECPSRGCMRSCCTQPCLVTRTRRRDTNRRALLPAARPTAQPGATGCRDPLPRTSAARDKRDSRGCAGVSAHYSARDLQSDVTLC